MIQGRSFLCMLNTYKCGHEMFYHAPYATWSLMRLPGIWGYMFHFLKTDIAETEIYAHGIPLYIKHIIRNDGTKERRWV